MCEVLGLVELVGIVFWLIFDDDLCEVFGFFDECSECNFLLVSY